MDNKDKCYFLDEKYDCKLRKLRSDKPRNPCVAAWLLAGNPNEAEHIVFEKAVAEQKCICYTNDETLAKQLEDMFKGVAFGRAER